MIQFCVYLVLLPISINSKPHRNPFLDKNYNDDGFFIMKYRYPKIVKPAENRLTSQDYINFIKSAVHPTNFSHARRAAWQSNLSKSNQVKPYLSEIDYTYSDLFRRQNGKRSRSSKRRRKYRKRDRIYRRNKNYNIGLYRDKNNKIRDGLPGFDRELMAYHYPDRGL